MLSRRTDQAAGWGRQEGRGLGKDRVGVGRVVLLEIFSGGVTPGLPPAASLGLSEGAADTGKTGATRRLGHGTAATSNDRADRSRARARGKRHPAAHFCPNPHQTLPPHLVPCSWPKAGQCGSKCS